MRTPDERFEAVQDAFFQLYRSYENAFYTEATPEEEHPYDPLVKEYKRIERVCVSLFAEDSLSESDVSALEKAWKKVQDMVRQKIR